MARSFSDRLRRSIIPFLFGLIRRVRARQRQGQSRIRYEQELMNYSRVKKDQLGDLNRPR